MAQRRRWERVRTDLAVIIDRDAARPVDARTLDLCENGLGVLSPDALDVGAQHRFSIPDIAPGAMVGVIRWCMPSIARGGFVLGVELVELSAEDADKLADHLASARAESAGEDE